MYQRSRSKYGNRKVMIEGITFDSSKEANRYGQLMQQLEQGEIKDLELQKSFELIPKQKDERPVYYKADFSYYYQNKPIVEDVKGYRTKDYIIKRKLFKICYPEIEFREL